MARLGVGSILHGGPIELFLVLASAGYLYRYQSGPLPYARRHIIVNKMC